MPTDPRPLSERIKSAACKGRQPANLGSGLAGGEDGSAHQWPGTGLEVIDNGDETFSLHRDRLGYIASGLTFCTALELGDLVASAQRAAARMGQGNAGRVAVIDTLLQALRPTIGNIPLRLTTEGR